MILGILLYLRYSTSFVAILAESEKGWKTMWEGSVAAQRSATLARKWPGRRES
jgi:hypothetical protein